MYFLPRLTMYLIPRLTMYLIPRMTMYFLPRLTMYLIPRLTMYFLPRLTMYLIPRMTMYFLPRQCTFYPDNVLLSGSYSGVIQSDVSTKAVALLASSADKLFSTAVSHLSTEPLRYCSTFSLSNRGMPNGHTLSHL